MLCYNGHICDMSTNVAEVMATFVDGYICGQCIGHICGRLHMWTMYRPHLWILLKSTFVAAPSGHKRENVSKTDDNCSDKPCYEILIIPTGSEIFFLETLKVSVVKFVKKISSDRINFNV